MTVHRRSRGAGWHDAVEPTASATAAEIPPHDLNAEQAVLGVILLEGATIVPKVIDRTCETDFYTESHRAVFRSVCRLHAAGHGVDLITVTDDLREVGELALVGGPSGLALLLEQGSIAANLSNYIEIVLRDFARRRLIALGRQFAMEASNGGAPEEIVTRAQEELEQLHQRIGGVGAVVPLGIGAGAFLAREYPTTEPYVEGILSSDGGGWIGGEEKLGKTYYALEEALCLALGEPVSGRFAVPWRRRVLFIEEEDSPRRTQQRMKALLRGHGGDPEDLSLLSALDAWFRIDVWSGFTFDAVEMVARLELAIADFRPSVVYIDVLRKVTLRDLNKAVEASALLGTLDQLRRKYGVLFRIIHHYRKAQGFRAGRGSQEISGSFVLGAWAENSLFFEPMARKEGAVKVEIQCKDGPPQPGFRLRIESEGPAHAPVAVRLIAEPLGDADSFDDVVCREIAKLETIPAIKGKPGVPFDTLVKATGKSPATVRRSLSRLTDAGRLVITGTAEKQAKLYAVASQ